MFSLAQGFAQALFAAQCLLPWGGSIQDGASVVAWNYSIPPRGLNCQAEVRTCQNGFLTGSYTYLRCHQPARLPN